MSAQIEAPPALTAKEKLYILRHPADAQLEALLRECSAPLRLLALGVPVHLAGHL